MGEKKRSTEADKQFITADELVARWGYVVTRGTLANWRSKRVGPPFIKLRTRVLYPLDSLIMFEQNGLHANTETNGSNDNK